MKKMITMMMGLSLMLGVATVAFADDAPAKTKKMGKHKKAKTAPAPDTTKAPAK